MACRDCRWGGAQGPRSCSAFPRHSPVTGLGPHPRKGQGKHEGQVPSSSGLAVGPGGWPPHSPSALVHSMSSPRGWPGIPGPRRSSGGVRQAPPAGLNTDALQSREPAPRPSACPLHCRRLRPLPLPARSLACGLRTRRCPSSFPGALWQVHEAGRACLLCRGTMWLGTWATGRREKASGGSGPRAWVLLDPDGFLAGPAQGLPAGEGHAQTVPSWPVLLPPGPSLHTWPWTCRARAHLRLPVLCTRNGLSHLHLASFSSPSRASPSGEQHRTPPCTPALRSKALPLPARTGPLGATRHGLQPSGDSDAPQDLAPHLAQRPRGTACLLPQL